MKANKSGCFVLIAFAVAFAIVSAVTFILQALASPVTLSSTPIVSKSDGSGNIRLEFALENVSDKDVTISYIEVAVSTDNETEYVKDDIIITTLEAGEYRVFDYEFPSNNIPENITKITVRVNGKNYNVLGKTPGYKSIGLFSLFLALLFALLTAVCFLILSNKDKRYAAIERELEARFAGNAVFVIGKYGKKGETGKAIAKSTASVLGGALFAVFFGFGAYKIYSAYEMKEFVVTDDMLYVGNPAMKGFNLDSMYFMPRGTFGESEVIAKKKSVTMRNKVSGEFFIFNLSGNKAVTAEQLADKLNKLLTLIESNVQNDGSANNGRITATDNQGDDPFDI